MFDEFDDTTKTGMGAGADGGFLIVMTSFASCTGGGRAGSISFLQCWHSAPKPEDHRVEVPESAPEFCCGHTKIQRYLDHRILTARRHPPHQSLWREPTITDELLVEAHGALDPSWRTCGSCQPQVTQAFFSQSILSRNIFLSSSSINNSFFICLPSFRRRWTTYSLLCPFCLVLSKRVFLCHDLCRYSSHGLPR